MTDAEQARDIINSLVRKVADLSDVTRAVAVASRLMTEHLETIEAELIELLTETRP
jgi:hypothetical protein